MRTGVIRVAAWLATAIILLLLLLNWFAVGVSNGRYEALRAPTWIIAMLALIAIIGIQLFAWRPERRRAAYAVVGLGGLILFGFSLREVTGPHITEASDNLCYRMDGWTLELIGERHGFRRTYWRGIWPTAFSEAAVRETFVRHPVRRGDGWQCGGEFEPPEGQWPEARPTPLPTISAQARNPR